MRWLSGQHSGQKHCLRIPPRSLPFTLSPPRASPVPSVCPRFHGLQDITQASKYANLTVKHDRYNAKALVNMGNVLLERGDLERAKELYLEAIGVEADCVEAIFNLGLVRRRVSGRAFAWAMAALLYASTAVTASLHQGHAALLVCA